MNFLELTKLRYSARAYSAKSVEAEKIDYVIECARLAPSAVNRQPWLFVVAESAPARAALCKTYRAEWLSTAPVIIAVCADSRAAWTRPNDGKCHADVDASIAAEHICLAAADCGLGSCWVCNFDAVAAAKALDLPDGVYPVVLIPVGYATDSAGERHNSRKPADEVSKRI